MLQTIQGGYDDNRRCSILGVPAYVVGQIEVNLRRWAAAHARPARLIALSGRPRNDTLLMQVDMRQQLYDYRR